MSVPQHILDKLPSELYKKYRKIDSMDVKGKSVKLITKPKAMKVVGKVDDSLFPKRGMNTINLGQAVELYHGSPNDLSKILDLMIHCDTKVLSLYKL